MSAHLFTSISPSSGQLVNLYTVPALTRATVRVICTNRGAATAVKVSVAPGGATDATSQYILNNEALGDSKSIATAPLSLSAGDVVRVSSTSGNVNFHITGLIQNV